MARPAHTLTGRADVGREDGVVMGEKGMAAKTYAGFLQIKDWGEAMDILFLSTLDGPLAQELDWMTGKQVTARYWVTNKECTKEEAEISFLESLDGVADVECESAYSEVTGYLWTDENLKIGGHDLLDRLKSDAGKWLILEVEMVR